MHDIAGNTEASHGDYVGLKIQDVPKPAAVLDAAKIRRHCDSMLEVTRRLGVGFRAHIKTHKTIEIAAMQVGNNGEQARLVVSTVAEIEHLVPLLTRYKREKRGMNVLYGMPIPLSKVPRIASIAKELGPRSLAFMLDHSSQTQALSLFHKLAGFPAGVFIKVDTGYHRAGIPASYLNKGGLVEKICHLESEGEAYLIGLYSHSSLSYQGANPQQALVSLTTEISGCVEALHELRKYYTHDRVLTISVGASPQATAMQALLDHSQPDLTTTLQQQLLEFSLGEVGGVKVSLEIHAGVYSIMDLQQLATRSMKLCGSSEDEIALSILAEVVSVYNDHERQQPEALVAVGTLGLGREPCKGYRGWGVVSSRHNSELIRHGRRLIVDRISQEHAILAWEVVNDDDAIELPPIPLVVGQNVFLYPNHACVAGAMYKHYFVVDSDKDDRGTLVQGLWNRGNGW
ncbi:alanine racemase domain protein [Stagonosporopsis vannaccii]|nr:alanine racemase domain protein [Stagonosporopsis vannaccii]